MEKKCIQCHSVGGVGGSVGFNGGDGSGGTGSAGGAGFDLTNGVPKAAGSVAGGYCTGGRRWGQMVAAALGSHLQQWHYHQQ